MIYKIILEKNVSKELLKIEKNDKETFLILNKKILNLSNNPIPKNKSHIIKRNNSSYFYELSFKTIRIYYEILQNNIIINKITYLGFVKLIKLSKNHKSGNSTNYSNQQKYINSEKKKETKKR